MSLLIRNDEMTVIDYSVNPPVIVFDVDEKLFNCTDLVSGSITLGSRQASITNGQQNQLHAVNVENLYTVASINTAADIVLGGFKVSTSGGSQGLNNLGVFDAGGTYVHMQEGGTDLSNPSSPFRSEVISMATYTFEAGGGLLRLRERVALSVSANTLNLTRTATLYSVRFDYKLYVGTLT